MPRRRTQISPHLDYADLTQRYVQCQDAGEKNRWLVIRLLSHPKTPMSIEQTAEICGLSCSGVRKIARRYNVEGAVGLVNRQRLNPGGNRLALQRFSDK
ncbi:helix-turn-helix domain-containing protein [Phormidium sp. CLA17]|uniref:helix-turn-helix domain-containing protein n=1 Tax=Leptolyngbya sp. Cla-17 TaxID=2803751 RepID=UPI00149253C9|nr:helix-turn-helix domain-containing protein [Leptolyngbya sp. Cla-17]MBM0744352.1 helix-turn-helix domain-containing protein [Leptolyngbya sp. Cla-17]